VVWGFLSPCTMVFSKGWKPLTLLSGAFVFVLTHPLRPHAPKTQQLRTARRDSPANPGPHLARLMHLHRGAY
jgi:hypothetical protein